MNFDPATTHVAKNWRIIKEHWTVFSAVSALIVGGTFAMSKIYYGQQIAEQQSHISLLQDQLSQSLKTAGALATDEHWLMTDAQKASLAYALGERRFSPILVVANGSSRSFASQLAAALRTAGDEVVPSEVANTISLPVGLSIGVTSADEPSDDARAIARMLKAAGLEATFVAGWPSNRGNSGFDLLVGPRPW